MRIDSLAFEFFAKQTEPELKLAKCLRQSVFEPDLSPCGVVRDDKEHIAEFVNDGFTCTLSLRVTKLTGFLYQFFENVIQVFPVEPIV